MNAPDEVLSRWTNAAASWDKHGDIMRGLFAPVSEALMEDAGIAVGSYVLDVATGAGEPALRVAGVVGPAGEVVGVDPMASMIESARRMASQRSLENVRFEVARAETLPFPADHFDAVISRFGVMFFPSPVSDIREMLRVVKPGGVISFAVWHHLDDNPFHSSMARVVESYAPEPALPPDAPEPFRFASSGKLRAVVEEAGARDVSERVFRFSISAPLTVEEFWNLRLDMSEKLRQRLAALPPEMSSELKGKVLERFGSYATAQGVSMPAEALIVTGRK